MTTNARTISDRARRLAGELRDLFRRAAELAGRLNHAQGRLQAANERLWTGLHPDALGALYGSHPALETIEIEASFASRSQVLEAADPLAELQAAHWQIHEAFIAYQDVAEDRRHIAADIGETIARMVDELVAAGWSEHAARSTNVDELAEGL